MYWQFFTPYLTSSPKTWPEPGAFQCFIREDKFSDYSKVSLTDVTLLFVCRVTPLLPNSFFCSVSSSIKYFSHLSGVIGVMRSLYLFFLHFTTVSSSLRFFFLSEPVYFEPDTFSRLILFWITFQSFACASLYYVAWLQILGILSI